MERSAFESFDGVEIRLLGGEVVRCPAFTVSDAAHFIRLLAQSADGDSEVIVSFVEQFIERVALGGAKLTELGFELDHEGEPVGLGDLTYDDGRALCELLRTACWAEDIKARSVAQVRWLDEAPATFGLDLTEPEEVFAFGRDFCQAFYLHIYGLAEGFCSRLAETPKATTWRVLGPEPTTTKPPSTSATGSQR